MMSDEFAQWRDWKQIQMRTKEVGTHANMVERHHDLLRRILHVTETQLTEEGMAPEFETVLCECVFAKNALLSISGVTPYQAVLGRTPPVLADFEPSSDLHHDDAGLEHVPARGTTRVRELAIQAIVSQTGHQRLT